MFMNTTLTQGSLNTRLNIQNLIAVTWLGLNITEGID